MEHGIAIAIRVNEHMGNYCGYARVPKGHLWDGLDYDDPALDGVIVHGGITFAGPLEEITDWWLGFDCAHAGDFIPGIAAAVGREPRSDERVWTEVDVRDEARKLARQIAEAAK
jgi:hypothetical protein